MPERSAPATAARPADRAAFADPVTMPLLTRITQQALDADYAHVAARKQAVGDRPPQRRPHRIAAVVVAVFGVLVTTAALQTSRNADTDQAGRNTLIARIEGRRDQLAAQQTRIEALRERNAVAAERLADTTAARVDAQGRQRRLELSTGFSVVTGPGIRVSVDDAPGAVPGSDGVVRNTDLRLLVNGLWQAGAEAIAVGGQRLTALSSILYSGTVIEVNNSPVSPPYVVTAIGDDRTLQTDLLATASGQQLQAGADLFGYRVDMQNVDDLTLPAAPLRPLRHARSVTETEPPPEPTEPTEPTEPRKLDKEAP